MCIKLGNQRFRFTVNFMSQSKLLLENFSYQNKKSTIYIPISI